MNFRNEQAMVDLICSHLTAEGWSCVREMPLFAKRIDVVARQGETLIAYEAKLHRWKDALRQAQNHGIAVQYTCVVVPEKVVSGVDTGEFIRTGVGLKALSETGLETVIEPRLSTYFWSVMHQQLINALEQVAEVK